MPAMVIVAYIFAVDVNIVITAIAAVVAAVGVVYAMLQGRRTARSERDRDEERRRAAHPSVVIEAAPDRLAVPDARFPRLTILAFKPGPDGLAFGACLGDPTPSAQVGAVMSTEYGGPREPHVNLLLTNVGRTTAVGLRLPLDFTYTVTAQDLSNAGDPPGYGLYGETKTVTLELPTIPKLEPLPADGVRVSIWNETGLTVTIESGGRASDVDPQRGTSREIVASTPAKIVLPSA